MYNDYTGYCIQQWWFLEGSNGGETIEVSTTAHGPFELVRLKG